MSDQFHKSFLKKIGIILCFFLSSLVLRGQQLPLYTQYKLNQVVINPATAGVYGYTTINLTAREQWLGLQGSPNTYTLSGQWRLLKRRREIGSGLLGIKKLQKSREGNVGLGGVVFQDQNGAISRTGIKGAYAYHIKLYQSQLSFGLGVSAFQFKIDEEKLEFEDEAEPLKKKGFDPIFAPDATVGIFYLSHGFYSGLAVDQLFETAIKIGNRNLDDVSMQRQYNLNAGYRFNLWVDYYLEPSFLIKFNEQLRVQSDLNLKMHYRDNYWAGLSYRVKGSTAGDLVAMGGFKYKNIYIAYSFDYTLSRIQRYSFGSHELSLGLRLGSSEEKHPWRERY